MKQRRKLTVAPAVGLSFLFAGLLLILGCQRTPEPQTPSTPGEYRRVVSLIPSATELLYELDLGDRLVAVTSNDHYPPEVESLPKVGDQTVDLELVIELQPDLVILDTSFNRDAAKLRSLGLELLELKSDRLDDISTNLRLLGEVFDHREAAAEAIERFESSLAELPTLPEQPTVFLEVWSSPLMSAGSDTYLNDLLELIGAKNIYLDTSGYFTVEPESFLERLPQVVILTQSHSEQHSQAQRLSQRVGHQTVIIDSVPSELTRPSTRSVAALRGLAERIEEALDQPQP